VVGFMTKSTTDFAVLVGFMTKSNVTFPVMPDTVFSEQ
jgi:hypothetical protein